MQNNVKDYIYEQLKGALLNDPTLILHLMYELVLESRNQKRGPSDDDVPTLWHYGLWSFQMGDTKLDRFLPKNKHTQRKILNFELWINDKQSKSAKI